MTFGGADTQTRLKKHYEASGQWNNSKWEVFGMQRVQMAMSGQASDQPSDQPPGGIGGEAGFGIDDSKIHIIRHPDNADLARDNDVVANEKDNEQPSQ